MQSTKPFALLCLLLQAISPFVVHANDKATRPNVLFIMADDLGVYLNSYGNEAIETPNIDRLAATGTRFDQAYCQYPLCGPSRVSLLSGRRPSATKVYVNEVPMRYALPDVVTLPQAFGNAGYQTIKVGKLYHGNPYDRRTQAFREDHWDDDASWLESYWFNQESIERELEQIGLAHGRYKGAGSLDATRSTTSAEDYPDGLIASTAIEKLRENKDRPFFLAVGFFLPHTPWIAPSDSFDEVDFSEVPYEREREVERAGIAALPKHADFSDLSELESRQAAAAYYACISYLDTQVGRVLDELKSLGLDKNTIVVFLGDHGYQLGHHGLWHKYGLFDQTLRTPLIIRDPQQKQSGQASYATVEFVDVYPTLIDLAAIKAPGPLDGRSLRPLLEKPNRKWNHPAYSSHVPVNRGNFFGRSVRWDRWHYFIWKNPEEEYQFLFDLKTDPQELHNLANDPAYAKQLSIAQKHLIAEDRASPYSEAAVEAQKNFPPDLDAVLRINRGSP